MSDAEALEKFALVPNEVLNTEGIAGGNLLTWSSEFHRTDLVKYLLDRGADPFFRESSQGKTALEWAEEGPSSPGLGNRDATIQILRNATGVMPWHLSSIPRCAHRSVIADSRRSITGMIITLNWGPIAWKS